jgi:tetratricopeptide (TPR) repeat protein
MIDKAIEFKPDYHEAWNNRGSVLGYLGRFEEAIASYDKALEINPHILRSLEYVRINVELLRSL